MRVALICVGRLGRAPEAQLAADYAARAAATGRIVGVSPVEIVEVEGRRSGKAAEADAILGKAGQARLVACDEHGRAMASREFAAWLGRERDAGVRELAFAIGGADGLGERVLDRAAARLAFGPQTWPHALARVMLAEQVYRATTILAGGPYHRD